MHNKTIHVPYSFYKEMKGVEGPVNKDERLNDAAAMNNNLGSSTIRMNDEIMKQHKKPEKDHTNKK